MRRIAGYRELLEKEVIEAWRTHRLVLVAALYVALGITAPVIIRYLPEIQGLFGPANEELGLGELGLPDAIDLVVRNIVQFGSIAAVLLAMGAVAGERERGTLALTLSKPVSRTAFLVAKFVSIAMVLALATGLGILAMYLYATLLYGPTDPVAWFQVALVLLLAVLVPASITFLGSVVAPSPLGAGAVGVASLVVLSFGSTLPSASPWFSSGLAEIARAMPLEGVGSDLDPAQTIGVSVGIVVVAILLSWWRFRSVDI
ncbi:MAG TPA: ABC transporter permease subunit [Candidatus Limnocylindrales bacterium]|nr:ABC transporter permease subunit [Candidatus Limnocylindrales bacterium]